MIVAIASGKGGTGKTTVATNLVLSLSKNVQLLDCDVEEPNAHIFIKPDIKETYLVSDSIPKVDCKKCTFCGKCAEICAFNAIAVVSQRVLVFPEICHSCGACQHFCPEHAISEIDREIGFVECGLKDNVDFVQGKLNIGELIATPVIKAVKKHLDQSKDVIIDVPPGTSCPVIESLKGVDFCVLVTEPTPFGLHDLKAAIGVLKIMNIPYCVVINRSDMGNDDTKKYCQKENVPIFAEIPFQKAIAKAYAQGIPLVTIFPEYKNIFQSLFKKIEEYQ